MQEELYSQDLWDKGFEKEKLGLPPNDDQIRLWLEAMVPDGTESCIEIGCFPGRYLAVMGKKGYEVSGLDLTPRTKELEKWFKENHYRVGSFINDDFWKFNEKKQFALVMSHGFIEHFTNWQEALLKHVAMVKPGGLLVVSTPNFAGPLQRFLHSKLDTENFNKHHIPSMDPYLWAEILKKNGFEIKFKGFFASFDFWNGYQKPNFFRKLGLLLIRILKPVLKIFLPINNPSYAPYCGIIAIKKI